ncbi:MAG: choice-of-anchor D domain-containing protein [bacterium]|nr:choice-of-anchor D domain-containing protein [bacterium]
MIGRLILCILMATGLARAQLEMFLVDGPGSETPITAPVDFGSVPSGDYADTKFRIRNNTTASVTLERLRVLGVGFSLRGHPSIPFIIQPGLNVDFRVRFQPANFGAYSASLQVNDVTLILLGSSPASTTLSVEEGASFRLLSSGDTVFFGQVERKQSISLRFRLENPATTALKISSLEIGDGDFFSDDLPHSPLLVPAGFHLEFTIAFTPSTGGAHLVPLTMDGRTFMLEGAGLDPPFPAPEILLEKTTFESGQQGRVSVELPEAPEASGHGQLRIEFQSVVDVATDDPAVQFLATGKRTIPLSVAEGSTQALLDGATDAVFQTGTTAGSITFTVVLGVHSKQASVSVPAAPVAIDTTRSRRTATGVEVEVIGFDNTLSTSAIAFQFFDTRGGVITATPITAQVTETFRGYFETAQMGGMFSLLAQFPVAGDASQIGSVEVEFTNSTGKSEKRRVDF